MHTRGFKENVENRRTRLNKNRTRIFPEFCIPGHKGLINRSRRNTATASSSPSPLPSRTNESIRAICHWFNMKIHSAAARIATRERNEEIKVRMVARSGQGVEKEINDFSEFTMQPRGIEENVARATGWRG